MKPAATVVLDNEAVQALIDGAHPKHRWTVAFLDEAARRTLQRRHPTAVVVPAAVRVEAGWDRTRATSAGANRRIRARDVPLDRQAADRAARLRRLAGVSVVDATVGQAAEAAASPVVVLTSDVADMRRLAALVDGEVRVVRV